MYLALTIYTWHLHEIILIIPHSSTGIGKYSICQMMKLRQKDIK